METTTLVDRIFEALKQKILKQEFAQNEKLNLTAIAKELNVSNTPLREAISRLEKVGLVKTVPFRGPYVRGLSPVEVAEAYDVRIALETLAARLVAAGRNPETLSQLNFIHQQYLLAFEKGDHNQIKECDLEFHRTIAQASSNGTLLNFVQMLADWIMVFMQFRTPPPRSSDQLIREHAQILKALQAGDVDKAGQAIQQHLVAGKDDLLSHLAHQSDETDAIINYPNIW